MLKKNKIIQDAWPESPCSSCFKSPCCSYVPLVHMPLENRTDFLNLALLACYDHIRLGLNNSGEWSIYYNRDCRFLHPVTSQCSIHGFTSQSLICKTYDAYRCWYKPIFVDHENEEFIFFDLNRLLALEKQMDIVNSGFNKKELDWNFLIHTINAIPPGPAPGNIEKKAGIESTLRAFKRNSPEQLLFFPPYEKPQKDEHFDLITFRLGFPGIFLAIADNCWAFMIRTRLNKQLFRQFALEYFPTLHARHGCFSFFQLNKDKFFFSEIGEKWVILQLEHIQIMNTLTRYDSSGNIKRLPTTREVLDAIRSGSPIKPDKAA